MKSRPLPARPELTAALERSVEWFNALTPEQQNAHRYEQRRSWLRGEMGLKYPEMTAAEIAAHVDRVLPPLKPPTPAPPARDETEM